MSDEQKRVANVEAAMRAVTRLDALNCDANFCDGGHEMSCNLNLLPKIEDVTRVCWSGMISHHPSVNSRQLMEWTCTDKRLRYHCYAARCSTSKKRPRVKRVEDEEVREGGRDQERSRVLQVRSGRT